MWSMPAVTRVRVRWLLFSLVVALVLGGCTPPLASVRSPDGAAPNVARAQPPETTGASSRTQPSPASATPPAASPAAPMTAPLSGKVIVIDPGHNGKYKASYNTKQVPAGNGRKKACNSSGTAGKGLSEHAYTWAQAKLLKAELERLGAKVKLTRANDSGLGPCVDKRARTANDAQADLLISIHADGNNSRKARGFHVIVSTTMDGSSKSKQSALEKKSRTLAKNTIAAIDEFTAMPKSTYIGKGTALSPRSDIATLNLLKKTPGIMLEAGNMRNASDLKLLKSTAFRKALARALTQAAVKTLNG